MTSAGDTTRSEAVVPTDARVVNTGRGTVKCVVWDLDNTLWDGVLLEGDPVVLRRGLRSVIETLDRRGILNSVASRNDPDASEAKLRALGVREYFLHPQINWGAKSSSVRAIAAALNIGLDSIAFVDDEPFEREEVAFSLPKVRCIDARDALSIPGKPEFTPPFITDESSRRREMYAADLARTAAEQGFSGPKEEFLARLDMKLHIKAAEEADLQRAEELTVRTNQLNATGYTYSYDELNAFRASDRHKLLIGTLEDKYGAYGSVGLALTETMDTRWTIKLLLMSCRVMSRGVGAVMIIHLKRLAKRAGARLYAEFVDTGRNRMMYVSYRLGGFSEVARQEGSTLFEADLHAIPGFPTYIQVTTDE